MNIEKCESMTIGEVNDLIRQLDDAIREQAQEIMSYHGVEDFSESQSYILSQLNNFMAIKEALVVYNKWSVCNTDTFTAKTETVRKEFYNQDDFIVGAKMMVGWETANRGGTTYDTHEKFTHYISEITDAVCTFKRIKRSNEIDKQQTKR